MSADGTEQIHDRLGECGLKEYYATGSKERYYQGYCDALEWVLNHSLDTDADRNGGGSE